jgi:molecular chaperone DnaK (HSP70)
LYGEDKVTGKNKLLGNFKLENIRLAKKSEPRIQVSITVDVSLIMSVTSKDLDTEEFQSFSTIDLTEV